MLSNCENKCLQFWTPKVRRKSPAAYQEARVKKKKIAGHSRESIEHIEIFFFRLRCTLILKVGLFYISLAGQYESDRV